MGNSNSNSAKNANYRVNNNHLNKQDMIKKFQKLIIGASRPDFNDLETLNWSEGNTDKAILPRNLSHANPSFNSHAVQTQSSDFSELERLKTFLQNGGVDTATSANVLAGGGCGCAGDQPLNSFSPTSDNNQDQDGGARRAKKAHKSAKRKSRKMKRSRRQSRNRNDPSDSDSTSSSDASLSDSDSSTSDSFSEGKAHANDSFSDRNFKTMPDKKINIVPFYSSESTTDNYQHLQTRNKFL